MDDSNDSSSDSEDDGWVKPGHSADTTQNKATATEAEAEASEEEKELDEKSPYDDDFESASESEASNTGEARGPEADDESNAAAEERKIMSSQAARDHVFPILVSELIKENIVDGKNGARLMELFKSTKGDAVINAALDVYDVDNDMAELVDTLQRVIAREAQ